MCLCVKVMSEYIRHQFLVTTECFLESTIKCALLECHGMAHLVMRFGYIVLCCTGFFANAFTRRHPSETLNENTKHDHSMSSILHSSFLGQAGNRTEKNSS